MIQPSSFGCYYFKDISMCQLELAITIKVLVLIDTQTATSAYVPYPPDSVVTKQACLQEG